MAGGERIGPLRDAGKRREDCGERAASRKESCKVLGGCARREELLVSSEEMPRIEAGVGRDRREQARSLLALDRHRTQALRVIPREDLVDGPPAEAAVLVVEQHALPGRTQ